MKSTKMWQHVAWFIVLLVLTIPFYSANALAVSVQVTKNSGAQQIPGYLDATGDTWTVEATIIGSPEETIDPANVKLKIGTNEAQFQSCSDGVLGVVCQYLSPLSSGVREAEYAFQVAYTYLALNGVPGQASGSDVIRADGTGPRVEITTLRENTKGQTEIDFSVSDKVAGAPAIGIKTIEIVDSSTGNVIQTINFPRTGVTEYLYSRDSGFGNILQASLTGEGQKRLKVRAEDWLGHTTASVPVRSFASDFVTPVIHDNLEFLNLGKFIGSAVVATDITVDVTDTNLETVKAYSEQAELDGTEAACTPDQEQDALWHCVWKDIEVSPVSSVSVTIAALDSYGNSAERTIPENFIPDNSPPQITFFGTERTLEGKSYIKSGSQHIILSVTEQGAGIDADGILGDLSALGKSAYEKPTCTSESGVLNCYWDTSRVFSGAGVARIRLSKFQDKVGNEGQRQELELFIDTEGPKVESLEAYGVSAIGEKDYFQSNDQMKLKLTLAEATAPIILVNLNGIVMDAATQFPETADTKGLSPSTGWQVFTADTCERQEAGDWECVIDTAPLKSGPDNAAHIELKVQDTAGNDAAAWPAQARNVNLRPATGKAILSFKLLGLDIEEHPEYWEVKRVIPLGGESAFIDLETTPLTFTRMPFDVVLQSTGSSPQAISIELLDCMSAESSSPSPPAGAGTEEQPATEPTAAQPVLSRKLLYGGVSSAGDPSPRPKVILEFEPFDGKELFHLAESDVEKFTTQKAKYNCQLRIFSKVGQNALQQAEVQDVVVEVPFGFSALGASDANLEEIVKKEKDAIKTGFYGVIGTLAEIIKWLDYAAQAYTLIAGALHGFGEASRAFDGLAAIPAVGKPAQIAACFGVNSVFQVVDESTEKFIGVPLKILSCRQGGTPLDALDWSNAWTNQILNFYNIEVGKAPDSPLTGKESELHPARSVKDNLFLSIASLCVPGVIKNLDKLRQIKCRKVYCLENEVPANLATVHSCNELEGLLTCKYVWGELWYLIPFSQLYDNIIGALNKVIRDPIAILHTTTILACGISCLSSSSNSLHATCQKIYYVWDIIGWLENLTGFITTVYQDIKSGGLQYCDSIGL